MPTLRRSGDRKVTNSVTAGGNVRVNNAFGLLAGSGFSCPGATSVCESVCYAGKIEKQYVNVLSLVKSNLDMLQETDLAGMATLLSEMVAGFIHDSARFDAPLKFRIHWDGDFFSRDYALAWRWVILAYPEVHFWVYTRSFRAPVNVIDLLHDLPNLTIYLSADDENMEDAKAVKAQFPSVHLAILAQTFDAAAELSDSKAYRCPEINRRIELISPKGSACVRCGVCIDGRGDVLFSSSKK